MVTRATRILVKASPMPEGMGFSVGRASFHLQPLFPGARQAPLMGATAPAEWHVAELPPGADPASAWDVCHQLNTRGFGMAGAPAVEFAEPDLEQQWISPAAPETGGMGLAAADPCAAPAPPKGPYPFPNPYDWRWYQGDAYSGLASAQPQIPAGGARVTIAHLDTGYFKGHSVLPQFLDYNRQRSFVDGDPNPNLAEDPGIGGLGNNPGHGTGTLSILAGSNFNGAPYGAPSGVVGGAPFATVIPIRVANSVVLFTNSAIAKGIQYAMANNVDVISMSMGGVPSQLWADMVSAAYEAGITMVTAAGNNFGPFKFRVPRFIVYPARFHRVLAACGVMYNGTPYADFGDPTLMGGSYGPDSKMDTAMAAYTPNVGWARYGCQNIIDFNGQGTSAATPQIAAAAACWLQKYRDQVLQYPEKWMRVEAVRLALTSQAANTNREHFGKGTLRAALAMGVQPAAATALSKTAADSLGIPFLGPIWGELFGAAQNTQRERMLNLEASQILSRSKTLQDILTNADIDPDRPAGDLPADLRKQFLDAMAAEPSASLTLKAALHRTAAGNSPTGGTKPGDKTNFPVEAETPQYDPPSSRKLRVFAFDPILRMRLDTESINETTLEIPWEEKLEPGPVGEYLEVVDVDPVSNVCYAPVDLNHPHLLATNGLPPSEANPRFHQQMVYAVAMNTIGNFEKALGRRALWAPRIVKKVNGEVESHYVQRLRIYPHGLCEQNSYYSPPKKSLLFGYFRANNRNAGDNLPGGMVFCALSHDVVAHETTHALLDGLHRHYQYQTNQDIAAFHEAFADIVAIFQHFMMPEALKFTIAKCRGNLRKNNILAQLAQQFGQAASGSQALRSALGQEAKSTDYASAKEPHALGAVLLAAVFEAFLDMYDARVAGLIRLVTNGTGVLPRGDIPHELVNQMAGKAASTAKHVLAACIRALDYCPPVDLTFGDYLRALITADLDLEPEDEFNYRTAFISGFRKRGILPRGVRTLSEEDLRWNTPNLKLPAVRFEKMMKMLDTKWDLSRDRKQSYDISERNGFLMWQWLQKGLSEAEVEAAEADLGVYIRPGIQVPMEIPKNSAGNPALYIHSVRPARRISSRGQQMTDLVVEAIQRFVVTDAKTNLTTTYRGGCTVLIDMEHERIRYAIRKRVGSSARIAAEKQFMQMAAEDSQAYFDPSQSAEPFAMLHRGV